MVRLSPGSVGNLRTGRRRGSCPALPGQGETPWVRSRGVVLADDDRDANHLLSSLRMPVEHAVGRMKWWRALRYWRNAVHRFGPTGKAVATLASIT